MLLFPDYVGPIGDEARTPLYRETRPMGLIRAKTLSSQQLKKAQAILEQHDRVDLNGRATGSGTSESVVLNGEQSEDL